MRKGAVALHCNVFADAAPKNPRTHYRGQVCPRIQSRRQSREVRHHASLYGVEREPVGVDRCRSAGTTVRRCVERCDNPITAVNHRVSTM